ncbi:MAG TPA: aminotransferase class I/II-fold pyridoxal phosphate-dependent enzyme, partial [Vicinamibacterales bacterium]|nr:aminotransferase class I/II-fold pyridoxal phosphate-dependent enzyme [Vicinamibacterales bacterium]
MASAPAAVRFAPPVIGQAEIDEVVATLQSGWLSTGPRVTRFEQAFAAYVGAPYAVALNSCTAALHLALLALEVGPGDEVVTTPMTFCATANVVIHTGATPRFADIDPVTWNLSPAAAAAATTPRTRALLPVHFGGRPADVAAFRALADRHGAALIE